MKALVLASSALSPSCEKRLTELGFEPIIMPAYQRLQSGVSSHPDMLVFFDGNKFFCTREYYNEAKFVFSRIEALGYSPVLCDEIPLEDYPNDVIFNALMLGDIVFGLEGSLSLTLKQSLASYGKKIVNVKQGYTKCSICVVSDNAIITADKPIADTCLKIGMDVLLISEGHISLPPYSFGFIGGTSGLYKNDLYFCGSLEAHPDAEKIKEFCKKHGKTAFSLTNGELQDVGSIFFIGE